MGKSLDQLLADPQIHADVIATITVHNEDGVVGYAVGDLHYEPPQTLDAGPFGGIGINPARLIGNHLTFLFSNRTEGSQPFTVNNPDTLGVSFSRPAFVLNSDSVRAKFTLPSWGNASYNVAMEAKGNLLVGIGPGNAVYVVSFGGWITRPN